MIERKQRQKEINQGRGEIKKEKKSDYMNDEWRGQREERKD